MGPGVRANEKKAGHGRLLGAGLLMVLGLGGTQAHAASENVAAVFLGEPAGPRPAAMGGGFAAVADDANTVFWNPAGLIRVERKELLLAHTQAYLGNRNEYAAFCLPWTSTDAVGANVYFGYGDPLDKFTETGAAAGTFQAYDLYASLAYSRALDRGLSVGLSLKGLYQAIDEYAGWSVAADLGCLAVDWVPNLQVALVLRNLGKPMVFVEKSNWLDMQAALGGAYSLLRGRLLLTLDVVKPVFQEFQVKFGAEGAVIEDVLYLRGGYRYLAGGDPLGPWNGLTLGLGLTVSDYRLDYAYAPFGDLGDVHKVAVSLPFGRSLSEEQRLLEKLERQVKAKQKVIFDNAVAEGDQFSARSDFDKALQAYNRALGIQPDHEDLKRKIGKIEGLAKRVQGTENLLRAKKALDEQDFLTALVEASKAAELLPDSAEAKRIVTQANQRLSEEKVAAANDKNQAVIERYFQQGLQFMQKEKFTAALDVWKKILGLDPANRRVTQYLRVTRSKMEDLASDLLELADRDWAAGQTVAAVKKWRHVLDLVPEQPQARSRLSVHQAKISETVDEYYRAGVSQYVQNNLPEAIARFQSVLILEPDHPKALQHLEHAKRKTQELRSIE